MNLSTSQNRRLLREELHRRAEAKEATCYCDLSLEQGKLMRLNETLRGIEARYHAAALQASATLNPRVADPTDSLTDYEMELEVSYYLNESDPEYEEDDDNILMIQEEHLGNLRGLHHWDPDYDWAEPGSGFEGERHCWLFHDLYDHCGLGWMDLLRIGVIWVDFKITEQQRIELEP